VTTSNNPLQNKETSDPYKNSFDNFKMLSGFKSGRPTGRQPQLDKGSSPVKKDKKERRV